MICEKCGKEFFEDWRKDRKFIRKQPIPRFCSRKCSNTRVHSEECKEKIGVSVKESWVGEKRIRAGNNGGRLFTEEDRKKGRETSRQKANQRNKEFVLKGEYYKLSTKVRRKYILEESDYTCNSCKQKEWLGKPIPLEIHHKDGNKSNNERSNLEALCLNCHFYTDKYRFRGRKH